jgi:hypothetical protein
VSVAVEVDDSTVILSSCTRIIDTAAGILMESSKLERKDIYLYQCVHTNAVDTVIVAI